MKIRSSNTTPWLEVLLCLTLGPGATKPDQADAPKAPTAQNASPDSKPSEQGRLASGGSSRNHKTSTEASPSEGAPTRVNKASSILGMEDPNQNDEHLGHIKDIVIDWKTEQVSYAVLSTAPKSLFGIEDQVIAFGPELSASAAWSTAPPAFSRASTPNRLLGAVLSTA